MSEKTLSDFVAKDNKKLTFEERSEKFKEKIKPICEELGVIPWAKIIYTEELLTAAPHLKNLWESSEGQ